MDANLVSRPYYFGKLIVPKEVVDALTDLIEEQGLDCADNHRFAHADGGMAGMDEYEDAARKGCCGSFEQQVIDNAGRKWYVGCNYGH
jgi:hypothetical protein